MSDAERPGAPIEGSPPRDDRTIRRILLFLLVAVPLVPNPGLFTGYDLPKTVLLVAAVLLALLVVGRRALARADRVKVAFPENLVLVALAAAVGLFLAKRAPDSRATLRVLAQIGTLAAAGMLATRYLVDGRGARRAMTAIAVGGGAGGLLSVAGALGAPWGPSATFGNPSFAAELFAPAAILAFSLLFLGRRFVALAAFLLCVAGLVAAQSRADWLGLVAGAATYGLLELLPRIRPRIPPRAVSAVLLAGILALPFLLEVLPVPSFGRGDTIRIRELVRHSTLEMALDHPMSGVGLDGFAAAYPDYRSPEEFRLSLGREVRYPHNLPLSVFAETGAPGLLLLLVFLWVSLSAGIRAALSRSEDGIAFGISGALVAIFVSAQFSAPHRHPASALVLFVLAGIAVARRPRRYVTELKGRHRRIAPVLVLLIPVAAAAYLLPPKILADVELKAARDRLVATDGGMDEEVAALLRRSVEAEPSVDALRMLAFWETRTGAPEAGLAILDRAFALEPENGLARIERARALLALDRAKDAKALLDEIVPARPGDDIPIRLRAEARLALADVDGARDDIIDAIEAAPIRAASGHARWVNDEAPVLVLALVRFAERLGKDDLERALEVLSAFDTGDAMLHRAVILAAHDRLDEAMDALREARAMGAVNRDRLLYDPRLDPLRERADFRALLRGP